MPVGSIDLDDSHWHHSLSSDPCAQLKAERHAYRGRLYPPMVTSLLFGLLGIYTLWATGQLAGAGMCVVSLTSLAYHSRYTPWTRRIDLASNIALVIYFGVFDWRWYYTLCVPALVGGYAFCARFIHGGMVQHVLCVHVPALAGFACIAVLR